ncbi:uncharacterized protein LOC107427091 [Ziziphus jujuba]|uniref:Uncharacterized protein LOC107427091 n=1 Tax=Ziziphus jujuba TaxID=326968 RepID=A0A6P4AUV7_ZIZJJ|nr:uncharacterized protein LOC107427091 [Ziziphus jujuba]
MALPSNKSSSSPISGRANPNARNSEMGNPIRRSFTGNPFTKPSIVANPRGFNHNTPVNSPEHLRRNSVGRDTIVTLRDYEDKENGKDQNSKPSKVRSPMGSKGTKNFMSPTISAASKITQSPRKKILAERNEPLRASVTFSESKIPTFSQAIAESEHKEEDLTASLNPKTSKSEPAHETIRTSVSFSDSKIRTFSQTNADSERREEEDPTAPLDSKASKTEPVHDSTEPLGSNNLPETLCEPQNSNVTEETDSVNLDPSFKISPPAISYQSSSLFPTVVSLDSDPSMPPYDPKTNYLSPRPQFLHYRPNPRVELYLNKEREGKRLDDSFISEIFSDSDATEETQSESSQKELEDFSSSEVIETKEKLEEELLVSEPSPAFMSEEIDESSKGETRPRFFWWKKFIALLMVLSFACLSISITNSPVIDHSMFEGATFLKLYDHFEIAEFVRTSYDGLDRNLQVWSSKSMSYLAELISNLNGEKRELGSLHYCNLTTLLMDDVKSNGYMVLDHDNEGSAEVIMSGSTGRRKVHIEFSEEKGQPEIGDSEEIADSFSEIHPIPECEEQADLEAEPLANHISPDSEEVHQASEFEVVEPLFDHINPDTEKLHEAPESELVEPQETDVSGQVSMVTESATNSKEEPVRTSQAGEVQSKVSEAVVELEDKSEISSLEVVPLKEAEDLTVNGNSERTFSKSNVLGIAYWFLPLIAVAFIFMKRRNDNNTALNAYNTARVQPFVTKKLDYISTIPINPDQNTFEEKPASWNWVGESCPSEMSSFGTSSSFYSKRSLKGLNEAESQGRKTRKSNNNRRRESLASSCMDSSMGSPSYGSFTTYEKIPSKIGYADEETITPVRRSSRIRNLVTSP